MLLAAKIWHYWIGVALFFPAVLLLVGLVAGYLAKVTYPRYPRRR